MAKAPASSPFIWYDLMTSDLKAAEAFYAKAVGWTIEDSGMPGRQYSILKAGDVMVGGLMQRSSEMDDASPGWNGHVHVPDVDAYAKRIETAGGAVHRPPMDIPGVGRFAVVSDPQGAVFILFKPDSSESPMAPPLGTPGQIGWRELHAGDGGKAWEFYSGMFGWRESRALDMGKMGIYRVFKTGGEEDVGGMMTKMPDTPEPHWLYYFNADAIDAAAERVKQGGGKVAMGPHQVPGGQWIIVCNDPQGAEFGMVASKR